MPRLLSNESNLKPLYCELEKLTQQISYESYQISGLYRILQKAGKHLGLIHNNGFFAYVKLFSV